MIPDGVTSIGPKVFRLVRCDEITLPDSVRVIQEEAFQFCYASKIHLPRNLAVIEKSAFYGSKITEITIPGAVTEIADSVFCDCEDLTKVGLPQGLTRIGDRAFRKTALRSLSIPDNVVEIKDGAFEKCSLLTTVILPRKLKTIGQMAFGESGLTSLCIPDGVAEIPHGVCYACADLATVELGRNTTVVYNSAFSHCPALQTVRGGESLREIHESFSLPEGEKAKPLTLHLPASLQEIDAWAFNNRPAASLTVEYAGTYPQWKKVTQAEWNWVAPVNLHCHGAPSVGDSYLFGSYTFHDTVKPIEWIVLAVGADRMLLLSKYVLDAAHYHYECEPVTWEKSDLRRWLNEIFVNMAFGFADQNRILPTTVVNENNPKYRTKGGNMTTDKLFCLSLSEYEKLPYGYKVAESTPAASQKVEYCAARNGQGDMVESAYWWLRTPGGFDWDDGEHGQESHWASIACGTSVMSQNVENDCVGVRPALWIKK